MATDARPHLDCSGALAAFDASAVPTLPPKLFGLLGALTLAKADARAAAVFVDEFDAGAF